MQTLLQDLRYAVRMLAKARGFTAVAVLTVIVRQGLRLALIGVIAGLVFALAMTHFLASLLFRVSAFDGETFVAGAAILSIIVLVSIWFPARRASTRLSPCATNRSWS